MAARDRVHDRELLDRLDQCEPQPFSGIVWRVVRSGLDPLRGSTANGRWGAAGEFEVLYTACDREGALAEVGYRLSLEPIWPSRLAHDLYRVEVSLDRILDSSDFALLAQFGVDADRYAGHHYEAEQAVSAGAHFLGFQAILVPNARHPGNNLVIYPEADGVPSNVLPNAGEPVDWTAWRADNRNRPGR